MNPALKVIGVVTVMALTLAAVAETSAKSGSIKDFSDKDLCDGTLNRERSAWDQNSPYSKEEALKRGLTLDACRQLLAAFESFGKPSGLAEGGTREQRAFLEAALFFITGVDTSREDMVANREIVLDRYPIVAYLMEDNDCAVRIRHTAKPYWVLQMDFCKITHWQDMGRYGVRWFGYKSATCFLFDGWDKNENYFGEINAQNSRCSIYEYGRDDTSNTYTAWTDGIGIESLLPEPGPKGDRRAVDRMIASFKYIVTLLTGKPY
jgi:hypothetical protein